MKFEEIEIGQAYKVKSFEGRQCESEIYLKITPLSRIDGRPSFETVWEIQVGGELMFCYWSKHNVDDYDFEVVDEF